MALEFDARSIEDLRLIVEQEPDCLLDMLDWLAFRAARDASKEMFGPHAMLIVSDARETNARIQSARGAVSELNDLLSQGTLAWELDKNTGRLIRTVSDEERAILDQATEVDDEVRAYLEEAWVAAWGPRPDGDKACDQAIKALEAAFRPVVTPKDPSASLGKIAKTLKQKPSKWVARLESALPAEPPGDGAVSPVVALAELLQMVFGCHHRHASKGAEGNSDDEGRDAIALAVSLVALQRRGFLSRRETV